MKRSIVFVCVIVAFFTLCVPSFAADTPPVRIGVAFTSDTFDIPDDLSNFVTNIFGNVLSKASNITLVSQNNLRAASRSLGFNYSRLSTPQHFRAVGEKANVNFIVWTRINYDIEKAVRAEAARAIGKWIKLPTQSLVKHEKPDFDVKVVDVASAKIVFDNKLKLDLFSSSMKNQILNGAFSGKSLNMGSLDTSLLKGLAEQMLPSIQTIVNEAALLAAYKDTGNAEGIVNTVVDLAQGKTHSTRTVANKGLETYTGYSDLFGEESNNSNNSGYGINTDNIEPAAIETIEEVKTNTATLTPSASRKKTNFENKSTDPEKVIKSYGIAGDLTKSLIKRHKEAKNKPGNQAKLEAYEAIFNFYQDDYLAAYGAALAEFEMRHGSRAVNWCQKALAINSRYLPASQLMKRAKGL